MTTSCPPPSISEPSEEQARALCLRLLTARARTRAELSGQLAKHGYPDDVRDRALGRLGGRGLGGDAACVAPGAEARRSRAGNSRRALAAELLAKGVDKDVIPPARGGIDADAERARAGDLVR